jgi:hypothetical protein
MIFSDGHLQFPCERLGARRRGGRPRWASAITNVTSTSPQPRGVGTTRTVDMRGGIIGDEEYLVWKPFIRIAFGSTKAVARPTRGSLQRCGIRARRRY